MLHIFLSGAINTKKDAKVLKNILFKIFLNIKYHLKDIQIKIIKLTQK